MRREEARVTDQDPGSSNTTPTRGDTSMHSRSEKHSTPLRYGAAARACPTCGHVFLVHADQWDCGCVWTCRECLKQQRKAS